MRPLPSDANVVTGVKGKDEAIEGEKLYIDKKVKLKIWGPSQVSLFDCGVCLLGLDLSSSRTPLLSWWTVALKFLCSINRGIVALSTIGRAMYLASIEFMTIVDCISKTQILITYSALDLTIYGLVSLPLS